MLLVLETYLRHLSTITYCNFSTASTNSNDLIFFSVPGNANSHSNSYSQPNLLNRFTSGVPSILGSTKTKSIDESIVSGTSNFFNSINISNTVMGNHVNQGGGVVPGGMQHNQHTNQQQHRRLPATPNKPSTLFSQISTSTGFKSISNQINSQITKPSTLAFR